MAKINDNGNCNNQPISEHYNQITIPENHQLNDDDDDSPTSENQNIFAKFSKMTHSQRRLESHLKIFRRLIKTFLLGYVSNSGMSSSMSGLEVDRARGVVVGTRYELTGAW